MDRERLDNTVRREIIALIASGAYGRGRRLPAERELCRLMDVSRGTLRKALANLAELGVVSIKPNSGIYVESISGAKLPREILPPDFGAVDLADVIEARKAIELPAVERACGCITRKQRHELAELVDRMAAAVDDLSEFLKLDMQFHQALVRASGNMVLSTAFEAIYEYHRFSSVFTSRHEGEEELALDYHRRLLAALERGDARNCRAILREHLDYMTKYSVREESS